MTVTPGEWIPWEGGECPVEPGTPVEVILRAEEDGGDDNRGPTCRPERLRWIHLRSETLIGLGDIIAYRVVSK
jgi:hypothetical protein